MAASGDTMLYAKRHTGRGGRRRAAAEWRWLHLLPMVGVEVPAPVAWLAAGGTAMVVTSALAGRSLDAWALDAAREGWLETWFAFVCDRVAPTLGRLHRAGLVHRDCNLAHLFAVDPRTSGAVAMIDVERVFRPRWRRRRWLVKDLASLLASSPVPVPGRLALRFLRQWAPDLGRSDRRRLVSAIAHKARRIGAREPRFG